MANALPDIAPYSHLHQSANGPGDQRPTAIQVIKHQDLFGKLGHLNILVTGGNSGVGKETVKALHAIGARVIITVAPGFDGEAAAREIESANKYDPELIEYNISYQAIETVTIDLGCLSNVRATAAEIRAKAGNQLNVLVCNAGVMTPAFAATENGFEPHFGINYLGHFLLFNDLADILAQSSMSVPSFHSRVVLLSSTGHRAADVDVHQLPPTMETQPEGSTRNLYCESKTELLWKANEIERRFKPKGIHGILLNPGSILTPLTAHIGWNNMRGMFSTDVAAFDRSTKSLAQGGATTAWAAVGQELEGKGGFYLDDLQVAKPAIEGSPDFTHGYNPWAYDEDKARQLWDLTVKNTQGKRLRG